MGALRLFMDIAAAVKSNPALATSKHLEEVAAVHKNFSYIGSRKVLSELVLSRAPEVAKQALALTTDQVAKLRDLYEPSAEAVNKLQKTGAEVATAHQAAATWFGPKWEKDSGVFPDFVLGRDASATFGNGALLEVKSSKGGQLASFNSTIPTRMKALSELATSGSEGIVCRAAILADLPHSITQDWHDAPRTCLYLVRTDAENSAKVRISVVEGSFFETVTQNELLTGVWKELLTDAGIDGSQQDEVAKALSGLSQESVVKSRKMEGASVKPRLRLMAEVHPDGNPHIYPAVSPGTVNLIVKKEWSDDCAWLEGELAKEGVQLCQEDGTLEAVMPKADVRLGLSCTVIKHKRNGEHLLVSFRIPEQP